jgi:hypothetical protein
MRLLPVWAQPNHNKFIYSNARIMASIEIIKIGKQSRQPLVDRAESCSNFPQKIGRRDVLGCYSGRASFNTSKHEVALQMQALKNFEKQSQ